MPEESNGTSPSGEPPEQGPHHGGVGALTLAALGVVFGDIGTSPLYALKECLMAEHIARPTQEDVLGVLSLIIWALLLVVALKYLIFIMRASNRGEGGILALLALTPERVRWRKTGEIGLIAGLVLFGASLLYGDGMLTPAISVLGAVEGLEVATDQFKPLVIPITVGLLIGLFSVQRLGTERVGRAFGPIMVVWFVVLGALGVFHLSRAPQVVDAFLPIHAVRLFQHHGYGAFVLLGSVFLAVTGGEALYADMGHFGVRPIRLAWWGLVLPALVLNYLGQGALILTNPHVSHPFYGMVPQGPWTYALVVLATAAAIIASQALISGAFSLTRQAIQLGVLPRTHVVHTSPTTQGQIYVPLVNWALLIACVALVLMFKATTNLAAAYGIAVTGTMFITSIVYFVVVRQTWGWSLWKALPLLLLFLTFDIPFLAANAIKIPNGGYIPLVVGLFIFLSMAIWRQGRVLLRDYMVSRSVPMVDFVEELHGRLTWRVPGVSVFMASNADSAPPILVHYSERIRVMHAHVILLTVQTCDVPYVAPDARIELKDLGKEFYRVVARYGFMESPDVPRIVEEAIQRACIPVDMRDVTYLLGRESFVASGKGRMGRIAETCFGFLSRNAQSATAYFGVPHTQVLEIGSQIDL